MTESSNTPERSPASVKNGAARSPLSNRAMFGMAVMLVMFFYFAHFLYQYAAGVGAEKLTTIEGIRPLLVVSAIFSTIVFGGALLFGSLFSTEGTFDERFRRAREIFLVFSGVFGTVVGFYFGAGDSKPTQLEVDAVQRGAELVVHAGGGTPPYSITLNDEGKPQTHESRDGWTTFTLERKSGSLKVTAVDSRTLQGNRNVDLQAPTPTSNKTTSAVPPTKPATKAEPQRME